MREASKSTHATLYVFLLDRHEIKYSQFLKAGFLELENKNKTFQKTCENF